MTLLTSFKKGFTLIELLVVIAIMGVIAASVLIAIDPVDKINAANDSRVQADIGQVAGAVTAYAVANGGLYPVGDWAAIGGILVASGELTKMPSPPTTGYSYTALSAAAGPVQLAGDLKSKKYTKATPTNLLFWNWCSTSGAAGPKAGSAAADAANCP
ncbi:MAG: type II secretion system protein [bacterium]|nr:type II secretion system protein [bacterium]